VGYFRRNLNILKRTVLFVAGIMLIIPLTLTNVLGLILVALMLVPEFRRSPS
jgi:TRAP-type uncharacterized transport system fused permease subunit